MSLRVWYFAGVVVLSAFAGVATATPVSAAPLYSAAADVDLGVQFAQYNDDRVYASDRVCCKRGYRDWWSNRRECRRAGGYVAHNRACRNDRADNRGDQRVCCQRGRNDWWSTQRQCRRIGGYVTYNRACRNDRDNRPYGSGRY